MDTTTRAASPLRERMIEDMRMRKPEPRTREAYIRAVRKLTAYLKRSPDTASVEDLRNFQLHLFDGSVGTLLHALGGAQAVLVTRISRGAHRVAHCDSRGVANLDCAVDRISTRIILDKPFPSFERGCSNHGEIP